MIWTGSRQKLGRPLDPLSAWSNEGFDQFETSYIDTYDVAIYATRNTQGDVVKEARWYQKNWVVILLLIVLPPLGLFLLWKEARWERRIKLAVTLAVGSLFAVTVAVKLPEELERRRALEAVMQRKAELAHLAAQASEERSRARAAEDARWRELLKEGGRYHRLLSERLSETPDPQKRIRSGVGLHLGDFNGRVVSLDHEPETSLPSEYQPPCEGYSFRLLDDLSFKSSAAGEAIVLVECVGFHYLATYEVIGAVYEPAMRFRIFDAASGELLGWYQTYPNHRHIVPNAVGEDYRDRKPDKHGRIYMNTDDPHMRQSGGFLFLNRLRDALK